MEKSNNITKIFEKRRSVYTLSPHSTLKETKLITLLHDVLKYTPSAFDSRSTRLVLLTGKAHHRLWAIVKETLCEVVAPEIFVHTEQKINTAFDAGYGTILFFEDWGVVSDMQSRYPLYRDNFPIWAEQTSAMHQFATWCSLAEAGMGASLQHYNPLIDTRVREAWHMPHEWRLIAQMPFGVAAGPVAAKRFDNVEDQLRLFAE